MAAPGLCFLFVSELMAVYLCGHLGRHLCVRMFLRMLQLRLVSFASVFNSG